MASHRYLICLLLLTASLTDPSKAACRDLFTKPEWKENLTDMLPDYISIEMDRKAKDVIRCSIENNSKANAILRSCFEDDDNCERSSSNITSVPFYHLMCLTDIAMNITEEEPKIIATEVCKVYEKVCTPFLEHPNTAERKIGVGPTNETNLKILIAFLIVTNILGPVAVYIYMRRQRNKESFVEINQTLLGEVQMTAIQPKPLARTEDDREGASLLKGPQCSITIDSSETPLNESPCQN